jgi:hypothetical protein
MAGDNLGLAYLLGHRVETVETWSNGYVIECLHKAWRSEFGRGARGHWSFSNLRFMALSQHLRSMEGIDND